MGDVTPPQLLKLENMQVKLSQKSGLRIACTSAEEHIVKGIMF